LSAGEELPEDDAEAVHVGQDEVHVARLVEHLWCRPVHAAGHVARCLVLDVLLELGEAKVAHLDVPLGVEQQVERLQIPVHDARRVEEVHALGGLVGHLGLERERQLRDQLVVQQLLE
jgi:hypothetical protein